MNYDLIALISIKGNFVHLENSFNSSASCCADDDTGSIIQKETYLKEYGWNEPKDNPRLATEFWNLWSEWNGKVVGGILLDDENTYDDTDDLIARYPNIRPCQIASMSDGMYVVRADLETNEKETPTMKSVYDILTITASNVFCRVQTTSNGVTEAVEGDVSALLNKFGCAHFKQMVGLHIATSSNGALSIIYDRFVKSEGK